MRSLFMGTRGAHTAKKKKKKKKNNLFFFYIKDSVKKNN